MDDLIYSDPYSSLCTDLVAVNVVKFLLICYLHCDITRVVVVKLTMCSGNSVVINNTYECGLYCKHTGVWIRVGNHFAGFPDNV